MAKNTPTTVEETPSTPANLPEIVDDVADAEDNQALVPAALRQAILAAGAALSETATISTRKIRVKDGGGRYVLPGDTQVASFSGVIVAAKHANVHWPSAWVKNQITPADCGAVMPKGDARNADLTPMPHIPAPYAASCKNCQKLEWGSATTGTGKGKACTEMTVLAVFIPALGSDLFIVEQKKKKSQVIDGHIKNLIRMGGHPMMFLTRFEIGADDDAFDQKFYVEDKTNQDLIAHLATRMDEANDLIYEHVRSSVEAGEVLEAGTIEVTDSAGASGRVARAR